MCNRRGPIYNDIKLNASKSEGIKIGTTFQRKTIVSQSPFIIAGASIPSVESMKIIDVTIDPYYYYDY